MIGNIRVNIFFWLLWVMVAATAKSQVVAFPGAEGFGKYATGGRGGKIVTVTNLNDDGEGSFRHALQTYPGQPLTVVFAVAGVINLKSPIKITRSNLTIAGQTAPGEGICLKGNSFGINCASDKGVKGNIIIRYLRSRPGSHEYKGVYAFNMENCNNVIIDHCSFSWANEECAAMYDTKNITVQWCIVSEGLYNAGHHKGMRAYGGVWGGQNASYHHNLIAHQYSRAIRFNGARAHDTIALVDYRNNVIYNWGNPNACYGGEVEINGGVSQINMVNNYYLPGPATPSNLKFMKGNYNTAKAKGNGQWFVMGNIMAGSNALNNNNRTGIDLSELPVDARKKAFSKNGFAVSVPLPVQNAQDAYKIVLEQAGAILPMRDAVDARIVNEVKSKTATGKGIKGNGIIDDPSAVGGWPLYATAAVPVDADNDGMPDDWEIKNGLNPQRASDASDYKLSKSYTNIEVYMNSLAITK